MFRRTDLDNFEIPATGRNVAKVSYATSLMRQGVLISTTEHLLSALIGMGVDNAIVELDNLELPILDGSALPYVQAILDAGIRTQRRRRESIRVLRPVEVREGNKFIGVYPAPVTAFSTPLNFPRLSAIKAPASIWLPRPMAPGIAGARTFGYKADEQRLRDMGLIRGANADNAIILGPRGRRTDRCVLWMNMCATRCSTSSATWHWPGIASRVTLSRSGPAMPCIRPWCRAC